LNYAAAVVLLVIRRISDFTRWSATIMSQGVSEVGSMTRQLFLTTIVVLASALWSSANAQLPPGVGTGGRMDKSIEDKYRSDEMERVRREAVKPVDRPGTHFPQIKEDFERIQLINGDLRASNSNAGLDHERVKESAAEIRKRATRLKSNLFPSASKEATQQVDPQTEARQDLKFLLSELDKAITNFVHNPMFENTKVVNPQDSSRAERELQKIIYLSGRTRKKAERGKT
jgi:hypothetical protein